MGILIALIISIGFSAQDSQPLVCDNLYELTIKPGSYSDGTGLGRTRSENETSAQAELRQKASALAEPLFSNEIRNNIGFREKVIKASGTECDYKLPPCQKYYAEVASYFYSQRQLDPQVSKIQGSLENKIKLIEDPAYIRIEKEVTEILMKQVGFASKDENIRNETLPRVKSIMLAKLDEWITDPELRERFKKRLSEVQYGGSQCPQNSNGSPLAGVLNPNAYYEPNEKKLYICGAFTFDNSSEFFLISNLAHELAHSIDPCIVSQQLPEPILSYPLKITPNQAADHYPIKGLLNCLKSEDAIGAERDQIFGEAFAGKIKESGETRAAAKSPELFDSFCHADQIPESFSDWFAAETLPDYIEKHHPNLTQTQRQIGYSNAFRYRAEQQSSEQFHKHPSREKRVNLLLLAQPKIRQQMGCAPEAKDTSYCAPPDPQSKSPSAAREVVQ